MRFNHSYFLEFSSILKERANIPGLIEDHDWYIMATKRSSDGNAIFRMTFLSANGYNVKSLIFSLL